MRFSRFNLLLITFIAFSVFNTVVFLFQLVPAFNRYNPISLIGSGGVSSFGRIGEAYADHSYQFAIGGWLFVVGALFWRGRVRRSWEKRGFEHDLFELFLQMRGSNTRIAVLKSLSVPKDRLQLARELGCDWNVADRQIHILLEHGLVREEKAYGNVKFYELTQLGKNLLQLLEQFKGI